MRHLLIQTVAGLMLMTLSVGCGKMSPSGASSDTSSSVSPSPTPTPAPSTDVVKQTNAEVADYDASNAALATQMGNLDSQLLSSINITNILSGGSLTAAANTLFNDVYTAIAGLYTKVNNLEANINTRIAGLNLTTPEGLAEAAALQAALTYVEQAKAKLNPLVKDLVTKMSSLTATVDADIAKLNQSSPLTWIAEVYWTQIEAVFTTYEGKLTALTQ